MRPVSVSLCLLCITLKQQLHGQLQLPRIEHRSGRTEQRIRCGRSGQRTTAYLTGLNGLACRVLELSRQLAATNIVRSVHADDFVHIRTIEQVEGISGYFQPRSLSRKAKGARETDVPSLEAVPLVRIAGKITNAIGGRDGVKVRIKAHKQCKRPRTLKNDDIAQSEVAQERIRRT